MEKGLTEKEALWFEKIQIRKLRLKYELVNIQDGIADSTDIDGNDEASDEDQTGASAHQRRGSGISLAGCNYESIDCAAEIIGVRSSTIKVWLYLLEHPDHDKDALKREIKIRKLDFSAGAIGTEDEEDEKKEEERAADKLRKKAALQAKKELAYQKELREKLAKREMKEIAFREEVAREIEKSRAKKIAEKERTAKELAILKQKYSEEATREEATRVEYINDFFYAFIGVVIRDRDRVLKFKGNNYSEITLPTAKKFQIDEFRVEFPRFLEDLQRWFGYSASTRQEIRLRTGDLTRRIAHVEKVETPLPKVETPIPIGYVERCTRQDPLGATSEHETKRVTRVFYKKK
ncbi:MAG: cell envelope integrity protein TolA [Betaproteobacteria bacterium]